MSDLISRQDAIDAISTMFAPTPTQKDMVEDCLEIIDNLPSAQPEPIKINIDHELTKDEYERLRKDLADAPIVLMPSTQPERKTGRWEYVDYGGFGNWHCTACRKICICNGDFDYCPNCGAKMEAEDD